MRSLTFFPVLISALCWIPTYVHGNTQELMILTLDHVLEKSEAVQDGMEGECLALLSEFEDEKEIPSGVVHPRHLSAAMRRGWWSCAHRIVECLSELNISFENDFNMESRTINVQMNKLKSLVLSAKPIEQSISPAFQWAQSGDEIFMKIKFAHKLDAPATIDIRADEVSFSETGLLFKASKDHKSFKLDLTFLEEIDPEASSWQFGSVGTASVTIKKKNSQRKWARLLKSRTEKPGNMHTWWSMQEQYEEELEKIEEEEEERKKKEKKEAENKDDETTASEKENEQSSVEEVKGEKKPKKKKKKSKMSKEDKAFRKQMKKLDDELRRRKKEIEDEAYQQTRLIEDEIRLKKEELEKQKSEGTFQADNLTSTSENSNTIMSSMVAWAQENEKPAYGISLALIFSGIVLFVFPQGNRTKPKKK